MLCPINYKFPGAIKAVVGKVLLLLSKPEGEKLLIASQATMQSKRLWADGNSWPAAQHGLPGTANGSRGRALVSKRSPANPRLEKEERKEGGRSS